MHLFCLFKFADGSPLAFSAGLIVPVRIDRWPTFLPNLIEVNPDFEQRYAMKVASCLTGESGCLSNIVLNLVKLYAQFIAFIGLRQSEPVNQSNPR